MEEHEETLKKIGNPFEILQRQREKLIRETLCGQVAGLIGYDTRKKPDGNPTITQNRRN